MDKIIQNSLRYLLGGFAAIIILFLFLEFTDKNFHVIPFISDLFNNNKETATVPQCFTVWAQGNITFAGCVVLLAFLLASICLIYNIYVWAKTANHKNRRGQDLKLLGSIMLLLWVFGWILFLQSFLYFPNNHIFVNSELLLRSAIASLKLFALDIDSNILDQINGHAHLKGAIVFICLLSSCCTIALLICLVSARLFAYLRIRFLSKVTKGRAHLYIFFGIEKQMELLAESVHKEDANSIRIFVEKTMNVEDDGKEGWNHLLTMLTHRRKSFKKVKQLDACLSLTNYDISSIDGSNDILGEAGLETIKNKIHKLRQIGKGAELHLFFLSENQDENIELASIIRNDLTINAAAENSVKVVVYCHARRNSVSNVIEHNSLDTNFEVRIVDSAHLSVERLKMKDNINLQPVNFVKFEKDGTTISEFNALVVGFGEVGQDAVRFLYEYGAFVNSDKSGKIKRSPFCCHVVDPNMREIAPHYMDTHLRRNTSEDKDKSTLVVADEEGSRETLVKLHSYGYKDQRFFNLLNEICDKLNYIVIAIGDDIEGATLAVWILKHAMRIKKDLRNFKILLRSYSPETFSHMEEIVKYYNGLFYAEIVNKAKDSSTTGNDSQDHDIIHIFGKSCDIYSFQSIVSNQILRESWQYYNSYYSVIEKTDDDFANLKDEERASGLFCSVSEPDYAWNIRRKNELKVRIEGSPNYSSVMSVRRKESQDRENALHRHSKRQVALKALQNDELLRKIESGIRYKNIIRDETNNYKENNKESANLNTLLTTLAQMEHLRWNASHEMLGYVYGAEKDEAYSEHGCLTDWDNLQSDIIRGYDYDVVDRSFRLADEERDKK